MAAMWFSLGILAYFILLRVVDMVQKEEAKKAGYDCDRCTCHCTGYHCHCECKELSVSPVGNDVNIS